MLLPLAGGSSVFTDPSHPCTGSRAGAARPRARPAGGDADGPGCPTTRERGALLFLTMSCRASGRRLLTRWPPDRPALRTAWLPAAGWTGRADLARRAAGPHAPARAGANAARTAARASGGGREDATPHDPGRCMIWPHGGVDAKGKSREFPLGIRPMAKCPRPGSRSARHREGEVGS